MIEIKPKYVDGEPCCGRFDCPEYHDFYDSRLQMVVAHCHLIAFRLIRDGWIPCIPALQRDRDKFKAERDEARMQVCLRGALLAHWTRSGSTKTIDHIREHKWEYLIDVFKQMDLENEEQGDE